MHTTIQKNPCGLDPLMLEKPVPLPIRSVVGIDPEFYSNLSISTAHPVGLHSPSYHIVLILTQNEEIFKNL